MVWPPEKRWQTTTTQHYNIGMYVCMYCNCCCRLILTVIVIVIINEHLYSAT